ncbi:hypothetical protein HY032_00900 [Candidatus Gottesmanbacteria bacterium]|nr:hypothetical protein [Candidatus Gottesmanbacteria bacterium]
MIVVLDKKATPEQIAGMAQDYDGYIKFVVDVVKRVLAGGGERHVDGEQKLLSLGSRQEDLWGGGIDWETKEIDYNSMINLRPSQNNPSRDVMSEVVRKQIDEIVHTIFGL